MKEMSVVIFERFQSGAPKWTLTVANDIRLGVLSYKVGVNGDD